MNKEDETIQKNPKILENRNNNPNHNLLMFNDISELLDFKEEVWRQQYKKDPRIQKLLGGYSGDVVENFYDTILLNPYIPAVPFYQQTQLLLSNGNVLYGGSRGGGKALSVDTVIPTPDGWKTMDALEMGDEVFDETGHVCTIVDVSPIMYDHQVYEVIFDDGSKIEADEDHLWLTSTKASRRSQARAKKPKKNNKFSRDQKHKRKLDSIVTTTQIKNTLTVQNGREVNHAIATTKALELPDRDLPIPPYTLGAWLGDGNSTQAAVYFGEDKYQIIEEIEKDGFQVVESQKGLRYGIHGLHKLLRENNLLGNKHIPQKYLRASKEQRLALIQGLMDTDGTCNERGASEILLTNKKIIEGVHELLLTLGIKCNIKEGIARLYGKNCGKKYRIKFTTKIPVFRLKRKLNRIAVKERGTQKKRYIKKVKPISSKPVKCITVDSKSKLYLAGNTFIPTHNSEACLMGALQYVEYGGWKVGIFRLTYPDLSVPGAIMDRALEWMNMPYLGDLKPHWDGTTKTFSFPGGGKVTFGHVQHEKDAQKYQGPEFHRLIFDEAVQFSESKLTRISAANRKKENDPLPLSIWYTGNPGGLSHNYFKERYVEGPGLFINSRYKDNPYLDHNEYEKIFQSIRDSDPVLYRQWKWGDWTALPEGKLFRREWFTNHLYDLIREDCVGALRFWDLAATYQPHPEKRGGDWTVGILLVKGRSGRIYLEDIVRFRLDPDEAEERIIKTSKLDKGVYKGLYSVRVEQEGGASAKYVIHNFSKKLAGMDFDGSHIQRKNKIDRARAFVGFIKHGNFKVKEGSPWLTEFLNEISSFPTHGVHDDQVDSLTGGLNEIFNHHAPLGIPITARSQI